MTKKERIRRFKMLLLLEDVLFDIKYLQDKVPQMSDDFLHLAEVRGYMEVLAKEYDDE